MIPKLRFKEFCGEWEEKRLGDIAEIYKGNVLSKSDLRDEGHPCVLYGELYTKYGEIIEKVYSKTNRADKNLFIGKINDVLIPSSGETAIDISTASCLRCDNVYIGGDLNVIRCNNVNGSFLSYNLNHKQRNSIAKFAQGVSVVHLYGDSLRKLKIKIPSLPEQTKIADFLSTVDDKIQNQQDKITHLENIKKGFMQKIFSRKIRFKDDGGEEFPEWEEKKLGDIAKRVMRKNNLNETNLSLTISAQYGLVDQETYFNRKVSSNDLSGYYVLNKGEFAYNKSYSAGYPFGAIKRLNKYEKGAVSTLYICFSLCENIDSNFIEQYFESDKWYREIYMIAVEGARNHGLLNVSIEDFFKTTHLLPCLKEEQKIADFLSSFDEKISTEKETLGHLKQLKKGLLQQMFV